MSRHDTAGNHLGCILLKMAAISSLTGAVGKLVAVACEPLEQLCAVDVGASPQARDAIEYLQAGGEVLAWLGDGRVVAAEVRQCLARCDRSPRTQTRHRS